ncbi:MAG TPA: carboxypeptidase-like regulatory domain-containing protein [Planctomycetaceae bacterium]|nr:carboxypeptidase-like regulatory domain-containing protein [Planctomycetaceae bacterium]
MSTQRCRKLIAASRAGLFLGLLAPPLLASFAEGPNQSRKNGQERHPAGLPAAIISGRVTNEKGKPLADVRVRVAIPETDMRFVDAKTNHMLLSTKTDAKGDYRLEIPGLKESTTVSLDAMKPGYQRLVGTLMSGGDDRSVEVTPGAIAKADLPLKPALYFAGKVVDEEGKPICGVEIATDLVSPRSSGGVERTASDSDGSFELFNCFLLPDNFAPGREAKLVASFFHASYLGSKIEDVYALTPKERETLQIVLKSGVVRYQAQCSASEESLSFMQWSKRPGPTDVAKKRP